MSVVLAIDIGTGSAKALAVDNDGNELYAHRQAYPTNHPHPNYFEQDPELIFRAVVEVIVSCPPEIKEKTKAISFSSAMHSTMAVDEEGRPLTPLIIWSDLRSKAESRALRASAERFRNLIHTGTPVHPMVPLCKIMWLRSHQPEVFARAHKFIGIKEYVWWRLLGKFEVDYGIASATCLFETERLRWFAQALEYAGIDGTRLSEPVSPYHSAALGETFLHEFGFTQPVRCVIGSSDGCLANLGSMAMDHNTLSLTIGTSGAVRRVVRNTSPDPLGRTFRYHLDEHTIIEGGATNNGAVLLNWYAKNFLNDEVDTEQFIRRAMEVPAGSDGLIFLPYVLGERTPTYDPDASGVFFGVKPQHTHAHFMRAILEGIGFALYSIAGLVESNSGPYSRVMASGGFTHSPQWVQIIADIFGKPVHISSYEDASALGAAMMGFKVLGERISIPKSASKVFQPESSVHNRYIPYFRLFEKLYQKLEVDFQELAGLAE
jgi:gluconokinase